MTTLDLTGAKAIHIADRDAVEVRIAGQSAWLRPGTFEDFAGQLYAVFAMKRALKSYVGSALRIRRNSDNQETDIGFDKFGWVDTAAIGAFVGSGSAYVSVWYDQSGNGRNATQTSGPSQPRIVNAGALETDDNSKPTIYFNGGFFQLNASLGFSQNANNLVFAANAVGMASASMVIASTTRNANISWYRFALLYVLSLGFVRTAASATDMDNPTNINRSTTINVWQRLIGRARFLDGQIDIVTDGVTTTGSLGTTTPTLNTVEGQFLRIGIAGNGGSPLNGKISCLAMAQNPLNVANMDRALAENRT